MAGVKRRLQGKALFRSIRNLYLIRWVSPIVALQAQF